MFRKMRRFKQEMDHDSCVKLIEGQTHGVLSVIGDDGYPYGVPLSYVFDGHDFYFHCALQGHKLDAIMRDPKVSFTIVGKDQIVPEEYTTYFQSVIAFGTMERLDGEKKKASLSLLGNHYTPGDENGVKEEIEKTLPRVCVLQMHVAYMSGKQARELMKASNH